MNIIQEALEKNNTTQGRLSAVLGVADRLLTAVDFYAKRYHDEHHMGESYLTCQSDVCKEAKLFMKVSE